MDKILNTKQRARDFELYDTPKLDTFGIQEYSQEARLEEADYSRPKTEKDNEFSLLDIITDNKIGHAVLDPWRQANVLGH
jgi:hypothetical protein